MSQLRPAAACAFKGSARTYDYLLPDGLTVSVGDKVVVDTFRGEATVEVIEVKEHSDAATKEVLRLYVPPAPPAPPQPTQDDAA